MYSRSLGVKSSDLGFLRFRHGPRLARPVAWFPATAIRGIPGISADPAGPKTVSQATDNPASRKEALFALPTPETHLSF